MTTDTKRKQGRPPRLTEPVYREAFSRIMAGESRASIARDYGLSYSTARRIAQNQWPKVYGGEGSR